MTGGTVGGAGFGVADVQDAGVDLLQRAERRVCPRLALGQAHGLRLYGLCFRGINHAESCGGGCHDRGADKAAAGTVKLFGH